MCFANGLKTMQKNLTTILTGLRTATHSKVPIFGMNYYDPLLGDWLAGPGPTRAHHQFHRGRRHPQQGHDHGLRQSADARRRRRHRVPILATCPTSCPRVGSYPSRRQPRMHPVGHHLPRKAPEGFGDDPNNPGAVVIAHTFEHTIGSLRPPN